PVTGVAVWQPPCPMPEVEIAKWARAATRIICPIRGLFEDMVRLIGRPEKSAFVKISEK
ncbi:hypothetical protein BJ165DRAFT_1483914, partial [Panaeolus papilionaceus]